MSCFPEATYSVYVDDELPADQVHPLELHLMQCRDCRGVVLALREEGDLLGDAMHERLREPLQLRVELPIRVELAYLPQAPRYVRHPHAAAAPPGCA